MGEIIVGQSVSIENDGIISRLALAQQRRLFEAFQEFRQYDGTVLDIGLAASSAHPETNNFMEFADQALSSQVTFHKSRLSNTFEGKRKKTSGNLKLPFADGEFDWACSSNVIEHMGSAERQFNLIREIVRVARRGAFVATANRLHPLNFSGVPRKQMLRAQDLYRMATLLPGRPAYDVGHKRVFGIKAHFFLMISKKPSAI